MNINKSPRRIKRDAGGRNKNPVAKLLRTPMYKPKVKASGCSKIAPAISPKLKRGEF